MQLQQDTITRLTAIDPLVPSLVPAKGSITWLTENIGDLASKVAQATGKLGIVGLVLTPGGDRLQLFSNDAQALSFSCPLLIQIQENVLVNRGANGTQIPALDLVKFCMKRLHFWEPKRTRISRIKLDPKPFELVQDAPLLVYDVRFLAPITIA